MYRLTQSTGILRLSDNAYIPADPANTDYTAYLEWLAEGNTPEPAPIDPPPTPESIKGVIVAQTQVRLDQFAQTRGYDGVNSAAKYKDITDAEIAAIPVNEQPLLMQFRAECRYLAIATARTWARLYIVLGEVQAGNRPVPAGFQDIEPELPSLEWPV